jgi:DNA repair protein RadC
MARKNMVAEDAAIYDAIKILEKRVRKANTYVTDPQSVRKLLQLRLMPQDHEVFTVVFLDARHGVIAVEDLFHGSLTGAAVYVGQVVRRALLINCAAVVVAHNHPSGIAEPSAADRELTERLRQAMALVEIRFLDHVVIGAESQVSFAERGWL